MPIPKNLVGAELDEEQNVAWLKFKAVVFSRGIPPAPEPAAWRDAMEKLLRLGFRGGYSEGFDAGLQRAVKATKEIVDDLNAGKTVIDKRDGLGC